MVDRHASLLQMIITYAAPRTEQTPSTGSMPALNRNLASIAPTASARAGQLTDVRTGRSMVPAANGTSRTCSNRVWITTQTARLRHKIGTPSGQERRCHEVKKPEGDEL